MILAAGLGTRMHSETPKHLHPLLGRRLADWVIESVRGLGPDPLVVVTSPDAREAFEGETVAVQQEPRGTADAVLAARGVVDDAPFLVLNSDNYYPVGAYSALADLGGSGLIAFESETLVREGGIEAERVLKYALIDATDDGWLRAIREKPAADDPLALRAERWVSMNVWSFTPVIFEACERIQPSARGELEIQDAVTLAMNELGERFRVLPMRAGELDLSSRADIAFVASRLTGVVPRP